MEEGFVLRGSLTPNVEPFLVSKTGSVSSFYERAHIELINSFLRSDRCASNAALFQSFVLVGNILDQVRIYELTFAVII